MRRTSHNMANTDTPFMVGSKKCYNTYVVISQPHVQYDEIRAPKHVFIDILTMIVFLIIGMLTVRIALNNDNNTVKE
jgi:hypothetical protein